MLKPCEGWAERLSAYLDGETTAAETHEVTEHLTTCDACRAAAELYRCDQQDAAATLLARGAGEAFSARVMDAISTTTLAPDPTTPPVTEDRYAELTPPPAKPRRGFFRHLLEWGVVCCVVAVFGAILFPVFARPREKSRQTSCINNQKQLAIAMLMWVQDHEETFPSADSWMEDVQVAQSVFRDPTAPQLYPAYAYNHEVAGRKIGSIPDFEQTVLTFDAKNGRPDYRHNRQIIMSYLDGHTEIVRANASTVLERTRTSHQPAPPCLSAQTPPVPKVPTIVPPTRNYGLADKLQIAYSASVALHNEDVQGAMERAELLFRQHDGFVLTSNFAPGDAEDAYTATVTGRVPAEKLGALLVEVDKLGALVSRQVNGEDLTASHMENVEVLEDLAGTQGNLEHIGGRTRKTRDALSVEGQRSSAASQASGRRVDEYKLKSRVTLAEVTVTISTPPKVAAKPEPASVGGSAVRAFKALQAFGMWLLTVIIPLVIWFPVWGAILGLVIYTRKRFFRTPR